MNIAIRMLAVTVALVAYANGSLAGKEETKIASIKKNELFLSSDQIPATGEVDATAKQLTASGLVKGYPTWSPDGKNIAFAQASSGKNALDTVVIIDQGGSVKHAVRVIVGKESDAASRRSISSVTWAGGRIYVEVEEPPSTVRAVSVIDPFKGQILEQYEEDGPRPIYSPSGKHVAYAETTPLHFAPDNTIEANLYVDGKKVFPFGDSKNLRFKTQPLWSSDGQQLAVVVVDRFKEKVNIVTWSIGKVASVAELPGATEDDITLLRSQGGFFVASASTLWKVEADGAKLRVTSSADAQPEAGATLRRLKEVVRQTEDENAARWCDTCLKPAAVYRAD